MIREIEREGYCGRCLAIVSATVLIAGVLVLSACALGPQPLGDGAIVFQEEIDLSDRRFVVSGPIDLQNMRCRRGADDVLVTCDDHGEMMIHGNYFGIFRDELNDFNIELMEDRHIDADDLLLELALSQVFDPVIQYKMRFHIEVRDQRDQMLLFRIEQTQNPVIYLPIQTAQGVYREFANWLKESGFSGDIIFATEGLDSLL